MSDQHQEQAQRGREYTRKIMAEMKRHGFVLAEIQFFGEGDQGSIESEDSYAWREGTSLGGSWDDGVCLDDPAYTTLAALADNLFWEFYSPDGDAIKGTMSIDPEKGTIRITSEVQDWVDGTSYSMSLR